MTSRFASFTEQDIEKVVEDKDPQTQKGRPRWQRSCSCADYLKTFYIEARKTGFVQCIIKQLLLDSVFVTSRIIKVLVRVISLNLRLLLMTPTSTLIILDVTKTSSNNCL